MFPYIVRVKALVKASYKSAQVNMDRYLLVLETVGTLSMHYGASVSDLLVDLYFKAAEQPLHDVLLTLTRLLLTKTDRTVLDFTDKLQRVNGNR